MRKSFLKVMALGVFALAGGAAVAHGKMVDGTIWVYTTGAGGGTTTAAEPNCSNSGTNDCAIQYYLDENNQPGEPTGEVRKGTRIL